MKCNGVLAALISIVSANFVALNLYMYLVVYRAATYKFVSFSQLISDYFEMVIYFLCFGLPVSILITLAVGLPLYFSASYLKIVNFFTLIVGGILIPVITMVVCKYAGWNLPNILSKEGIIFLASISVSGAIGGLTFYFLRRSIINEWRAPKEITQQIAQASPTSLAG